MDNSGSWSAYYSETARQFDESSLGHGHLADVVAAAAENFGDRPSVSTQLPNGACATLSFSDVDRLTGDLAVYLREVVGLRPGEVVALMSPNCIDFLISVFGVMKAGGICTNINPLYTPSEMGHQLRDSGARVLMIIDLFGDKVDEVIGDTGVETVICLSLLDFFPSLKKALMGFVMKTVKKVVPPMKTPHVTMSEALRRGASRRASGGVDIDGYRSGQGLDDTAVFQYTGGTTGRSKGAELSHRNILSNALATYSMVAEQSDTIDGDCILVALPLYHITAFALIMLPSLEFGGHSIMIPSPRPPSNLRPAFENHPISHFTGINTLFAALLEEPWATREVFGHLRFCSSGGAAQHVDVAARWETLTGVPIYQGYGLTECAGALTMNPPGANRPGYAGVPIPGTTVRVVDAEGRELPSGEAGEVVARGPSIMKGYLGRPEATADTVRDGWLHTGDIGVMDEDGYLRIVDRKKDMILVSGFNVYPNEVEDAIAGLGGVVEVGVIGVPDEKSGEAVKAFVVSSDPALTAEQVIGHCARTLTNYKRPRQVEFVDEIPKSPVGKILRRALRDMASG
jgi:long-chain acyl-CoA synthetase